MTTPTQPPHDWRKAKRECDQCGHLYLPKRFWQRYCSSRCCQRAYMKRNFIDLRQRKDSLGGGSGR